MAKKNNGTYVDVEVMEIARKYLSGIKLTESELAMLRMYAQTDDKVRAYLQQGLAARSARQANRTGSAEVASPNGMRNRWLQSQNQMGGYGNRVVSPGGFKKSGQDDDSYERMSAVAAEQRVRQNLGNPQAAKVFADGSAWFNGRKYSRDQVRAAIQRGASGATLDRVSQAIYDRYVTNAVEQRRAEQEQEAAARTAEREEAKKQDDLINSKMELKSLPDGWEYTRSQRKRFNQLQESFVNSRARKDLRPRDKQKFLAEIKQEMQDIVNSPMMTLEQPKSLEQQTKERIVTINGTQYFIDDSLKPSLLPKAESAFEKNEREAQAYKEQKAKEAEAKAEKERKEREKWEREEATKKANASKERENAYWAAVNSRATELMKDRTVKKGLDGEETVPGKSYEEAMAQAQKEVNSAGRFKGYFGEKEQLPENGTGLDNLSQELAAPEAKYGEQPIVEEPVVEQPTAQVAKPRTWQNLVAARQAAEPVVEEQVCPVCGGPLENGICYNENCPTNI